MSGPARVPPPAATARRAVPAATEPGGPLSWRQTLGWLVEDGRVRPDEAVQLAQRLGAGDSAQHPLVRLAGASLVDARDGRALDLEALTRWLAQRAGLPYLRIDPLKVDVARVTSPILPPKGLAVYVS